MAQRPVAEAAEMMASTLLSGTLEGTYRGASIDSRSLTGGELFFAFQGERTDGHRFVANALQGGARAAVVERRHVEAHPADAATWAEHGTVLQVEASLGALHALTRAVRRQVPERLIAITGSAGKTTTKEILASLLEHRFRVAKTPGNFNNFLGFPLALLSIPDDTEWMVAELGMSESGELSHLSHLARPDVAILTNVGPAHLEFFGSLDAIADAKGEILQGLDPEGLVIANGDDPRVRRIAGEHAGHFAGRTLYYGIDGVQGESLDLVAKNITTIPGRIGSRFELVAGSQSQAVELPLHGLYNIENFLAAATCAWALGLSLSEIADTASSLSQGKNRGKVHRLPEKITLVDDSYNSNPEALRKALESAAELSGERHWAILGDMLELGPTAPELHRKAGRQAVELGFQPVVGVGALSAQLVEEVQAQGGDGHWFPDAPRAATWASRNLRGGDTILVKGSRGVGLEAVVSELLERGEEG